MIKKVLIVGLGNIGSRHLEGLVADCEDLAVYVVDNDPHVKSRITERMWEQLIRKNIAISFSSKYDDLPPVVDYVIIATLSNVRLSVLENVLKNTRPTTILFEKVLFNKREHYDVAIELVDSLEINALTCCPRRIFPAYKRSKEFFRDSLNPISEINITGGDICLGCNGVHFVDLIEFFSGEEVLIVKEELDSGIIESKRTGFVEFSGRLKGVSGPIQFSLDSKRNCDEQIVVELISEDNIIIVREGDSKVIFKNRLSGEEIIEEHRTPFLSELSGVVANLVFDGEVTGLPTLKNASDSHQALLDVLSTHAAKHIDITDGLYPVT